VKYTDETGEARYIPLEIDFVERPGSINPIASDAVDRVVKKTKKELSAVEIDLINKIDALEKFLMALMEQNQRLINQQVIPLHRAGMGVNQVSSPDYSLPIKVSEMYMPVDVDMEPQINSIAPIASHYIKNLVDKIIPDMIKELMNGG
jgi:hypothetical protein